jgi:hypothetical protein
MNSQYASDIELSSALYQRYKNKQTEMARKQKGSIENKFKIKNEIKLKALEAKVAQIDKNGDIVPIRNMGDTRSLFSGYKEEKDNIEWTWTLMSKLIHADPEAMNIFGMKAELAANKSDEYFVAIAMLNIAINAFLKVSKELALLSNTKIKITPLPNPVLKALRVGEGV